MRPDRERLREVLQRHDAGHVGYRVGDMKLMNALIEGLSVQGGVIWWLLRDARRVVGAPDASDSRSALE